MEVNKKMQITQKQQDTTLTIIEIRRTIHEMESQLKAFCIYMDEILDDTSKINTIASNEDYEAKAKTTSIEMSNALLALKNIKKQFFTIDLR